MSTIRVALGQLSLTVGDLGGNVAKSIDAIDESRRQGAQIVALPELAIPGYPPEDLLHKPTFVSAQRRALDRVARRAADILAVIGFVDEEDGELYNAAALCHGGKVVAVYRKQRLPNYGVFDEDRYFVAGERHVLLETNHGIVGACVCEDVWFDDGPAISQGDAGAQVVININASPFHKGKIVERTEMLAQRATRAQASIAYVNLVGGQDELVFDGGSLVVGPTGDLVARLPQFEEGIAVIDVPLGEPREAHSGSVERLPLELRAATGEEVASISDVLEPEAEIYGALKLAMRDYIKKNGFEKVTVGLSGGIDSSLVATICSDAIGPDNVFGVAMPSEYSTTHSVSDAKELAANLGIQMLEIPIKEPYSAFLRTLDATFGREEMGLAEENLQSRIRGSLLMFISNRYGPLVVATGNKSESAVGYATLYGDMAGGFALIKDLFKHEVYSLSRWRNRDEPIIPESVLTKSPSAELRPDQTDEDSLPPYETLDRILEAYIENDASVDEIVARGIDRKTVQEVITMVDRAEYKRRQAAPGPKVTTKAFGRDRRLPITSEWSEVSGADSASEEVDRRPSE
jgi:NAD+ synthase (glutamine-hydrolysing)